MWLIDENVYDAMLKGAASLDASKIAEYEANSNLRGSAMLPVEVTADGVGRIPVIGVLTPRPDFLAMIFGGGNTTYSQIVAARDAMEADGRVKFIEYLYNSPGGNIMGLFQTADAIAATKKPHKAVVIDMAASAAFMLATQSPRIEAQHRATMVGSLGVKTLRRKDPLAITITSDNAPAKDPDPTTADGLLAIKKELNDVHNLYAEYIATGRKTTVEKVNADFGRGGVLMADEALQRGMIDSIGQPAIPKPAAPGSKQKATTMNLEQLKAEHPGIYAAAVKIGHDEGVKAERERVEAHLQMGETAGDMKLAASNIVAGAGFGPKESAAYQAASIRLMMSNQRNSDESSVAAAAAGAAAAGANSNNANKDAESMAVAMQIAADMGATVGAQ